MISWTSNYLAMTLLIILLVVVGIAIPADLIFRTVGKVFESVR